MRALPPPLRRRLRALAASSSANVATLAALLMPAAIVLAAVAVDEGALYVERRQVQGLADLAAIAATAKVGEAEAAAAALLAANGRGDLPLVAAPFAAGATGFAVQTGRYLPNPALPVGERFAVGAGPANAARVTLRTLGTRHFAAGLLPPPLIAATATASSSNLAAFSIGSRLASLDGGVLNALLSGALGTKLSLKLMDYEALATADIDALRFLEALSTEAHLDAASYDEVLASRVGVGPFASALASVADGTAAKLALNGLAGTSGGGKEVRLPLAGLLDLGPAGRLALGGQPSGLAARTDALSLLTAAALLASGGRQAALDLGAALPGLLDATVELAVGEPPQHSAWFTVGAPGAVVRTAQTRLRLVLSVGGVPGVLGASIRLPLYLELAFAEGRLEDVACPSGRPDSLAVTIAARPGAADAWIGDVDPAGLRSFTGKPAVQPARIASLPLIAVTGRAHAAIANPQPTSLRFSAVDIAAGATKSVSTHSFTGSLFGSLLGDLTLDVSIAGIDLGLSGLVRGGVTAALAAAAPSVDRLVATLLAALGVRVGEADLRVTGGSCGRAVLVQ